MHGGWFETEGNQIWETWRVVGWRAIVEAILAALGPSMLTQAANQST